MVDDCGHWLASETTPREAQYPQLPEMEQQLRDWASAHPDIASVRSIGKTLEGRDIMALRIGTGAEGKPGMLVTGTTHAREWNTLVTAMNVAKTLIDGYGTDAQATRIVDKGEVWVVPCLNPDGYAYTRSTDPMWRKNRHPITAQDSQCGGTCQTRDGEAPVGVDLNRNYWDGNPDHIEMYRPAGDKPCDTSDDSGPGYDDPTTDNFRGPGPASEPEVKAVTSFFLARPNVKGVIDHHSYGGDIMFPVVNGDPAEAKYRQLAAGMNAVMDKPYKVLSANDIPIPLGYYSGVAPFTWNANGKTAFLVEMGTQFQPDADELNASVKSVTRADLSLADWIVAQG